MAKLVKEMEEMKAQVVEDYYKQALATNQFMSRNFEMALKLQRQWRMQKIRKLFIRKK
jgi:predicted secreted Zn-dependent protease